MGIRWTRKRVLAATVVALPAAFVLWVGLAMFGIHRYSSVTDSEQADVAIVLGAAEYNNRPSPVFAERINHAVELYRQGQVKALIFTGGAGKGSAYAESEVGRDYAVKKGVPAADIHTERVSRVTYTNLQQAATIAQREGYGRALIVSDPLHMKRAVAMARDLGLDAHPSPTPTSRFRTWKTKRPFLFRETYYYCLYQLGKPLLD